MDLFLVCCAVLNRNWFEFPLQISGLLSHLSQHAWMLTQLGFQGVEEPSRAPLLPRGRQLCQAGSPL